MKSETLRKIYSRHGIENMAKACHVIEDVENLILNSFEEDKSCQDTLETVIQILKNRKRRLPNEQIHST